VATEEVHVGDIGTRFQVTILDGPSLVDLTGATVTDIIFKKPDGTTVTKGATVIGSPLDGVIEYVTVSGDIDAAGQWRLQVHLALPGGDWRSDIGCFTVYANL